MSKRCFVVSPIGEEGGNTRSRADKILKYIIAPVVKECGYEDPVRADKIAEPGVITTQVIEWLNDADLVVADLTESNPNVFYELAIRHMIQRPLVQLIEKGHKIPFDVASSRTVHVDHKDLDSVETAKEEIKKQIDAVEKDPSRVDNPISVSLDLKALKSSLDPEHITLANVLEKLNDIESTVDTIDSTVDTIESAVGYIDGIYSLDDVHGIVEEVKEEIDSNGAKSGETSKSRTARAR